MNIPIYRLEFEKKFLEDFATKSREILTSGRPLAEDKYVKEFEEKFAKLVGARYAVAVTNGTVAIELALKVIGVSGKTVLIPANTFFATSIAVTNAGGVIGLVDVEADNFSLDPRVLEEEILRRKKAGDKPAAVVIVHIGGIITKHIRNIMAICNKHKIALIEDAAHAQCSTYGSLRAGTIGVMGCFSFFPTKVMTTGEGGIITTNSKKYAELARSLKNFGRDPKNHNLTIHSGGNNYKMEEMTALLGVLECGRVLGRIRRRNELVKTYLKYLSGTSYVPVLQHKGLCSHYKMIFKTTIDTMWLKKYCRQQGIALTGEVYRYPLHKQPIYLAMFKGHAYPVSDAIASGHICPPLYPELTLAEVRFVCSVLKQAQKEYEKPGRKTR